MSNDLQVSEFFYFWKDIQKSFFTILNILTNEDLSFSFTKELKSIGDLLTHVAKTHHGWLGNVAKDGEDHPTFYKSKAQITEVEALRSGLKSGFDRLNRYLERVSIEDWNFKEFVNEWDGKTYTDSLKWVLWHLLEHDIHHRTQIKLQMKMLGKQIKEEDFFG